MLLPCAAGILAGTTVLFLRLWWSERDVRRRYQEACRELVRRLALARDRETD